MMPLFRDAEDVYQVIGTFFRKSAENEKMGPAIRDSRLVITFDYSDPSATITIDATDSSEGRYFAVLEGKTEKVPDVQMAMRADIANQFWLGKLNLLSALTRRQMIAKGPIPKILKLLPAIEPAYPLYRDYLAQIGREELLK